MKTIIHLTLIFSSFFTYLTAEPIDLESSIQDFVLETKQIVIPGFETAFNPSIIRWKGRLLMSFRIIPERKFSYNSEIGVVWLDENFKATSTPQILTLLPSFANPKIASRAEDGRLIEINQELYLVYDDNRDEKISKKGFRVYVAKLTVLGDLVLANDVEVITKFEGESPDLREKNWVPFDYQNELLFAYSLSPHRIFRWLPGTGECESFCNSNPLIDWNWGTLRGGTPGVKIDEDTYLSFFHSSKKLKTVHSDNLEVLHYFMGAYTFSTKPPFTIQKISPEPIVGENFYHGEKYKPYWHPVRVVYPVGFILDDPYIHVFYGRQDHEMWRLKIDKRGLLNSLKDIF